MTSPSPSAPPAAPPAGRRRPGPAGPAGRPGRRAGAACDPLQPRRRRDLPGFVHAGDGRARSHPDRRPIRQVPGRQGRGHDPRQRQEAEHDLHQPRRPRLLFRPGHRAGRLPRRQGGRVRADRAPHQGNRGRQAGLLGPEAGRRRPGPHRGSRGAGRQQPDAGRPQAGDQRPGRRTTRPQLRLDPVAADRGGRRGRVRQPARLDGRHPDAQVAPGLAGDAGADRGAQAQDRDPRPLRARRAADRGIGALHGRLHPRLRRGRRPGQGQRGADRGHEGEVPAGRRAGLFGAERQGRQG